MSSNVPTNEQNAAAGAGSDTDSISSLSSQAANINLDRSSPPPLLSSELSDEEGEITILRDDGHSDEEGPNEDGQMPFLDIHGEVSLPVEKVSLPCWFYTPIHKYTIYLLGLVVFFSESCIALSCIVFSVSCILCG